MQSLCPKEELDTLYIGFKGDLCQQQEVTMTEPKNENSLYTLVKTRHSPPCEPRALATDGTGLPLILTLIY